MLNKSFTVKAMKNLSCLDILELAKENFGENTTLDELQINPITKFEVPHIQVNLTNSFFSDVDKKKIKVIRLVLNHYTEYADYLRKNSIPSIFWITDQERNVVLTFLKDDDYRMVVVALEFIDELLSMFQFKEDFLIRLETDDGVYVNSERNDKLVFKKMQK